jgi:hypothetical protein
MCVIFDLSVVKDMAWQTRKICLHRSEARSMANNLHRLLQTFNRLQEEKIRYFIQNLSAGNKRFDGT